MESYSVRKISQFVKRRRNIFNGDAEHIPIKFINVFNDGTLAKAIKTINEKNSKKIYSPSNKHELKKISKFL